MTKRLFEADILINRNHIRLAKPVVRIKKARSVRELDFATGSDLYRVMLQAAILSARRHGREIDFRQVARLSPHAFLAGKARLRATPRPPRLRKRPRVVVCWVCRSWISRGPDGDYEVHTICFKSVCLE